MFFPLAYLPWYLKFHCFKCLFFYHIVRQSSQESEAIALSITSEERELSKLRTPTIPSDWSGHYAPNTLFWSLHNPLSKWSAANPGL